MCIRYPEENLHSDKQYTTIEVLGSGSTQSQVFHFDRVFPGHSSQKAIFDEIRPFIQSAIDGENVCIFAYGATGSGKTYTMQGPAWSYTDDFVINELSGILPRTADYLFEELNRLTKLNVSSKISISAIEIYNDNIFDLLDNNRDKQPLQIGVVKNSFQIKNLIWQQIRSRSDILRYIKEASDSRKSESTQFNDCSSRSHAIFQLRLDTKNKLNQEIQSYINIVDLAGSERSTLNFNNKSKEAIDVMKKLQNEANFINKSLTTLGRIISMLADKKANKLSIPYRESKLTMILQVNTF
jgi:kinesin family protein C1